MAKRIFICALLMTIFMAAGSISIAAYGQQLSDSELIKDVNSEELQKIIDRYEGERAVLVNMWATWCGPCVEEFPHIVEIQRKYPEELKVIFVSADFKKEPAIEFLREQKVDWTTYFKTGKDEQFINSLSKKWSGAMPFTKIIDKQGEVVASWENKADFETFDTNVKKALNP